jgi:hypothetical protein
VPSFLIRIKQSNWLVATIMYRGQKDYFADCLSDLRISEGKLSAWLVSEDESNIGRILAALAATRGSIQDMGYLLFDTGVLEKCEIKIEKSEGGTPDAYANTNWHHDLTNLSIRQAAEFAVALCEQNRNGRLMPPEVALALEESLASNYVAQEQVKPKREEIRKYAEKAKRIRDL